MEQIAPSPPAAMESRIEHEHVVFVLTAGEKRLFFATEPSVGKLAARETFVDAEKMPPAEWEALLRQLRPSILVTAWSCPELPLAWGLEEDCPLRYVCSVTGSVKPRVPRPLMVNGLLVTNWGTLVSRAVAEHAMLMALGLLRSVPGWRGLIENSQGVFETARRLQTRTLYGKRVGLHGFGAVARELVNLLRPYGVDVAAYSQGVPGGLMEEYEVRPCASLRELFTRSEVVFECEGLTPATTGSVTRELLELLPPDAVFVNVARGALADEDALADLAGAGRIRLGLDVFQNEPLPPDSPLLHEPRILLSPHIAGPTWETYPRCGAQALENLATYLQGGTPGHRVTLESYDRAT